MSAFGIGHNAGEITLEIEVRLFNSVTRFANGGGREGRMTVEAGTTVGELAERLGIPRRELFLVLVNGRDVTPGLVGDPVNGHRTLQDGDVVAFSGAVPYSYGYGAPIV